MPSGRIILAAIRKDLEQEIGRKRFLRQTRDDGSAIRSVFSASGLAMEQDDKETTDPYYDPESDSIRLPTGFEDRVRLAFEGKVPTDALLSYYRAHLESYGTSVPDPERSSLATKVVEETAVRLVRVKFPHLTAPEGGSAEVQGLLEALRLGTRANEEKVLKQWIRAPDPVTFIRALARNRGVGHVVSTLLPEG